MKKYFLLILVVIGCACTANYPDGESKYQAFAPDGIPFVVADSAWDVDGAGYHRVVITVSGETAGKAVRVTLPWRRPDIDPEAKRIVVKDAATDKKITNVSIISLTAEKGEIVFQPETVPGTYHVYYLPCTFATGWPGVGVSFRYFLTEHIADPEWEKVAKESFMSLPEATVKRFETRLKRYAFTPMGLIATESEKQALKDRYTENFIVFPEDRAFPISLTTVSARWATKSYNKGFKSLAKPHVFEGYALPNEYYTWQIGIWASKKPLEHVRLTFSDFTHSSGKGVIPASDITCFNQEGINWDGKPIVFDVNVPEDKVQALWCGLQIPETVRGGKYTGSVTVSAEGVESQTVDVVIHTGKDVLADKGDGDLWRHSRLRWLNSTIGMDSLPIAPYGKIQLTDNQITATGKTVIIDGNGLPQSIEINNQKILAKPMSFVVETDKGIISFAATDVQIKKSTDGLVRWTASSKQGDLNFDCKASMEFDGYLRYNVRLSSDMEMQVKDIRLVTSYTPVASEYFLGISFKGSYRQPDYLWNWKGPWDSFWMGGTLAGMHVEFRGGSYHGPLLADSPAPKTWANEGKGTIRVSGPANGTASAVASTGSHTLSNVPLDFEFALLITPVKPLVTAKYFTDKYYHTWHTNDEAFARATADGANIINIHHAQILNTTINYPFIEQEPLKKFVRAQHEQNRKVKLYYTIRELSTHAVEVHALKSLNHEIFPAGLGGGLSWVHEHLIDDYSPAWWNDLPEQDHDAAIAVNGFSRWINYYLEGLRWMFENYEIDGIYMDDVAYDREVMKRIRRIIALYRPGAMIDLHSSRHDNLGPANMYTDFFPYIDKLWFGERLFYNKMMPDEWLVSFSGIPFGLMGDMIFGGGNRYLGMVYGTTARHSWDLEFQHELYPGNKPSPGPVWKLWDSFGIAEAQMIGYWDKACPVKTNHPNVKATASVREGKTLISIGNFDTKDQQIRLSFDWKKLGLDPSKAILEAPFVEDFQEAKTFKPDEVIPVKSKEGWLLIIKN
jgi:hypothetical protein